VRTVNVSKAPCSWAAALAAIPYILACGNDLPRASRITDLRVIAVQADAPYASPGESVTLDALAVDPRGRELTWGWTTCPNPKNSSTLGCLDSLRERREKGEDIRLVTGTGLSKFTVDVPDDAMSSLPAEFRDRALVGVVAVACPGTLEPDLLAETTAADPVPVVCHDRDTGARLGPFDFVVGMKRIFVRAQDRNQNPVIASILWDGETWAEDDVKTVTACDKETDAISDCSKTFQHHVSAVPSEESFESGTTESGAPFEEQIVVQYYGTEGTFADDVRIGRDPETSWAAVSNSRGKETRFWLVVRDNRGGVTWAERRVRAE
jgi:hypothetical protein